MVAPVAIVLCAASSGGCLITGEPDYTPPRQTVPSITAVSPSPTELIIRQGALDPVAFTVAIRSQDDEDDLLQAVLLRDLGVPHELGEGIVQPYAGADDFQTEIPRGSTTDLEPRQITLTYTPQLADPPSECHSLTFQVFRTPRSEPHLKHCPATAHFARVTWFVALCDLSVPLGECNFSECLSDGEEDAYCPTPEETEGTP